MRSVTNEARDKVHSRKESFSHFKVLDPDTLAIKWVELALAKAVMHIPVERVYYELESMGCCGCRQGRPCNSACSGAADIIPYCLVVPKDLEGVVYNREEVLGSEIMSHILF